MAILVCSSPQIEKWKWKFVIFHGDYWEYLAPKIKLLPEFDLRKPYPLNWDEKLFKELPITPRQHGLVQGEHRLP